MRCGLSSNGSGQRSVPGYCEHGNEIRFHRNAGTSWLCEWLL